MTLVRRAARPLLASMFVVNGIDSVRNPAPKAEAAEKIIKTINSRVPQLPNDPETLVRINGGVQVGGGLALAAGVMPRLSASLLAVSLVPTTLSQHRFWDEDDADRRREQRLGFIKNLGLLGGLMLAAVDTEGRPGLAWRAHHIGDELQTSAVRLGRRARREAAIAAKSARQEAKLLRAETKARLAA